MRFLQYSIWVLSSSLDKVIGEAGQSPTVTTLVLRLGGAGWCGLASALKPDGKGMREACLDVQDCDSLKQMQGRSKAIPECE